MTNDWSAGRYEAIAEQLAPAAKLVLDQTGVTKENIAQQGGMRVLDVGCGTGNAAIAAAERGARAIGVDPSPRLVEIARGEAARRGVDATFLVGDASSLPLFSAPDVPADAPRSQRAPGFDVVVSVFGVIFAPDPKKAAAEMARVTTSDGRIVISAWLPEGALFEIGALRRALLPQTPAANLSQSVLSQPSPPPPQPFAWHDAPSLAKLFSPYGFVVGDTTTHSLAFTGASPAAFLEKELADHPLWVTVRASVDEKAFAGVRARALGILEAANEDKSAFKVSSRYVVATLSR